MRTREPPERKRGCRHGNSARAGRRARRAELPHTQEIGHFADMDRFQLGEADERMGRRDGDTARIVIGHGAPPRFGSGTNGNSGLHAGAAAAPFWARGPLRQFPSKRSEGDGAPVGASLSSRPMPCGTDRAAWRAALRLPALHRGFCLSGPRFSGKPLFCRKRLFGFPVSQLLAGGCHPRAEPRTPARRVTRSPGRAASHSVAERHPDNAPR